MKALITGATGGLGQALCRQLASRCSALLISGRDQEKLDMLARELKSLTHVFCHPADLGDRASRAELISLIHAIQPDLIINNAGCGLYGEAVSHTTAEQLEILEVNGSALLEITLEAGKMWRHAKREGIVMNISSAAGYFTYPYFAVYAAAKRFVIQLSQALDVEMKPYGIRVLCCCPGQIETGFRAHAAKGGGEAKSRFVMTPERAAHLILRQIEARQPVLVIDRLYRIGLWLAMRLPASWLQPYLSKEILSRINTGR
jgi:uncharacterized protein